MTGKAEIIADITGPDGETIDEDALMRMGDIIVSFSLSIIHKNMAFYSSEYYESGRFVHIYCELVGQIGQCCHPVLFN